MDCKIKSPASSLPSIEESVSPPSRLSHVFNDKVLPSASHPLCFDFDERKTQLYLADGLRRYQSQSLVRTINYASSSIEGFEKNTKGVFTFLGSEKAGAVGEQKASSNLGLLKINLTKSIIGHLLGAAGGVEAISTVKLSEEKSLLLGTELEKGLDAS
ncbi:hypothetical protein L2E82_22425 [Cichorium intybus]|uniref:Uncharacterized protein n=1 Tax=Cichorium intybus TaxID=13427 RepID=A0ACB9DXP3_CICIN|nr:hypothetical protein L2E82_22425 [Cichorium intybus]